MPFTLSHAAAAWPLRRTHLEFSALIVGCFAPDFTYFAFFRAYGFYGHTLPGVFLLDLPAGMVALGLFHAYLKRPLALFLPHGVRDRLPRREHGFSFLPLARFANLVISIVVGALTHVVWDSFTHKQFWPYRHMSILRRRVPVPVMHSMSVCKLLQHGSTLFGLAVLGVWIWHWYRTTQPERRWSEEPFTGWRRSAVVWVVPVLAMAGAGGRAVYGFAMPAGRISFAKSLVELGISLVTFFCAGVLVCGLLFRGGRQTVQTSAGE